MPAQMSNELLTDDPATIPFEWSPADAAEMVVPPYLPFGGLTIRAAMQVCEYGRTEHNDMRGYILWHALYTDCKAHNPPPRTFEAAVVFLHELVMERIEHKKRKAGVTQ